MVKMRSHARTAAVVLCLGTFLLAPGVAATEPPREQDAPSARVEALDEHRVLLTQLAGTWNVRQRMWTGPGSDPVTLPAATAQRRLIHGAYIEEEMELAKGVEGDPFTRSATVSWNAVNQTFEYFSIDSRLPQMMMYPTGVERSGALWFTLHEPFVAPAWGNDTDVPFAARLQLRPGEHRQVVRLHLRRISAEPTEEFVAFEYIYSRTD